MNSQNKDTAFLGQPRGLMTLFFTEMWERFSYYGMRAILIYYMYYGVSQGGLGMNKTTAASVMSIYGSLVYLASVAGGFISDRILGSRKAVFYGGVLIMLGHVVLAMPLKGLGLLGAILLIVAGTGMLKPNVSEMVGSLYSDEDVRRDAGFSIFVFGINLGALLAPIIVPWFGFNMNFHVGFSLAGLGMFFGLIQYYIDGRKYLSKDSLYPADPIEPAEVKKFGFRTLLGVVVVALVLLMMFLGDALTIDNTILLISILAFIIPVVYFILMFTSSKVTKVERSRLWAYVPLFIAATLFWAIEEQGSVVLALFAADQTKLNYGSFSITPANFQALNPLFIMLYTPIFAWMWTKLGKKQPSSPTKFMYGLVFTGLSYLFIALPLGMFGMDAKVNALWLVGSWAIVEIGEMLISPIGLSVTTKLAPAAFASQMMSMWFLSDAAGQGLNAQIVKLYPGHELTYFIVLGIVTLVFALVLGLCGPWISKKMQGIR